MKVLVLFVVGFLGCSLTAARYVSKCELRDALKGAIDKLPLKMKQSGLTESDFVTKIVCYVEKASNFSTSVVTELNQDMSEEKSSEESSSEGKSSEGKSSEESSSEGKSYEGKSSEESSSEGKSSEEKSSEGHSSEGKSSEGKSSEGKLSEGKSSEETSSGGKVFEGKPSEGNSTKGKLSMGNWTEPKPSEGKPSEGKPSDGKPSQDKGGKPESPIRKTRRAARFASIEDDDDMTLYGIFQLFGGLVCSNGTDTTANMCDMNCSDLTDDNIDDDISCVFTLIANIVENGFMSPNLVELRKVIRHIMRDDCKNIDTSEFFRDC